MKMIKTILLIVAVVIITVVSKAQDKVIDQVVAVVGGNIILKSDVEKWLKEQFNLSGVMINLKEPAKLLAKFRADQVYHIVIEKAQIHCNSSFSGGLLKTLFGEDATKVNSCALIPLKNSTDGCQALMALGSENTERFTSAQSTSYLDCLSQLIGRVLVPD